jgi:hypothetical protein
MEKEKIIKELFRTIFSSRYRKMVSYQKSIARFSKLRRKFNPEFGTNFWAHYERVGESHSYNLTRITAAKKGPLLARITNGKKWEIIKENLAVMSIKTKTKERKKKGTTQMRMDL